jgi:hypothetical protein
MNRVKFQEFERHIYKVKANNPGAWFLSALGLKLAADGLPELDLDPGSDLDVLKYGDHVLIYRFLIARSIEILLKGLMVAQGKAAITSSGHLDKAFKTHDLIKLLRLTGLEQDDKSELLIKSLQPFCDWAGNYPIPRLSSQYKLEVISTSLNHRDLQTLWNVVARQLFNIGWITASDRKTKIPLWDYAGDALRRQLGELPVNY